MINSVRIFDLAQLAEACYANLYNNNVLVRELQNNSFNGMAFSEIQAKTLSNHWQVIHHQPDTFAGYSATLFKRKYDDPASDFLQGQLVYAIRGTADLLVDLASADIGDLTTDGLAMDRQITGRLDAHLPRGGLRCWG